MLHSKIIFISQFLHPKIMPENLSSDSHRTRGGCENGSNLSGLMMRKIKQEQKIFFFTVNYGLLSDLNRHTE